MGHPMGLQTIVALYHSAAFQLLAMTRLKKSPGALKRCSPGRKFVMRIIFHPKKFTFYRSFKHHHQSKSFLKALVSPSIDQRKLPSIEVSSITIKVKAS